MQDQLFQESARKERRDTGLLVGVGGWAYLPIKKGNKLEVCSSLYDFIEINSTFYALPEIDRVKKWRNTVPESFEFTLRANRELTHVGKLKPTTKNFKIFDKMLEIARVLNSPIIHFQFPPSLAVTKELIKDWQDFFGSINSEKQIERGPLRFAMETRNPSSSDSKELSSFISEYDIIPTNDASRDELVKTSSNSKIVYTRVFGQGDHTKWSFDSIELRDLATKIEEVKAKKRYLTFHNLTMYEDASRMRTVLRTGKDQKQPPNAPMGLDSLKQVLASGRVKFPARKRALIEEFGWRTFGVEPDLRLHSDQELRKLDDNREYGSIEEILESLREIGRSTV